MRTRRRELKNKINKEVDRKALTKLDKERKHYLLNDKSVLDKIVNRIKTDLRFL